jgi:hypothetical protein
VDEEEIGASGSGLADDGEGGVNGGGDAGDGEAGGVDLEAVESGRVVGNLADAEFSVQVAHQVGKRGGSGLKRA